MSKVRPPIIRIILFIAVIWGLAFIPFWGPAVYPSWQDGWVKIGERRCRVTEATPFTASIVRHCQRAVEVKEGYIRSVYESIDGKLYQDGEYTEITTRSWLVYYDIVEDSNE